MPELDNAKRSLERATYTPLEQRRGRRPSQEGRAWDKWAYGAALRVTAREATAVVQRLVPRGASDARKRRTEVQRLAALLVAEGENPSSLPLDRAKQFEAIGPDLLLEFGTELAVVRGGGERVSPDAAEIGPAWHATASSAASTVSKIPTHLKIDRNALIAGLPDARVFRFHEQKALPASARRAAAGVRPMTVRKARWCVKRSCWYHLKCQRVQQPPRRLRPPLRCFSNGQLATASRPNRLLTRWLRCGR